MSLWQRIWACTAVAVVGGYMASGLGRWSTHNVSTGCVLWLLCGPLLGEAAHGALGLGRLWRHAALLSAGATEPALPYAQPNSPIARLQRASQHLRGSSPSVGQAPGLRLAELLLALIAAALALALAGLFAQQVELVIGMALALALTFGLLASAESAVVVILAGAAWCGGLATLGRLDAPRALIGLLVALLLSAATHLSPGSSWRAAQVGGGLILGALLAVARQPALAGLLIVSSLASLTTPQGWPQPLALQLAVAFGALLTGLAVGHWG